MRKKDQYYKNLDISGDNLALTTLLSIPIHEFCLDSKLEQNDADLDASADIFLILH